MSKHFFLSLILLLAFAMDASATSEPKPKTSEQVCVHDSVCFDSQLTIDGAQLQLLGATLFRYWGFKVYSAAFYVEESKSAQDALAPVNKYLVLHYHRGLSKADIVESSETIIARNPNVDASSVRNELDELYKAFRDVEENDRFALSYSPLKGTTLYFNDREKTTIKSEPLQEAYFGIWLSNYNVDEDLRRGLLGLE